MNTKHTIAAIAAVASTLLGAAPAFAAETPAQAQATTQATTAQPADTKPVLLASAATTATAAGTTVAAAAVTPAVAKPAGRSREEVRAEAAEAVRNHRSTMSQQYDLLK